MNTYGLNLILKMGCLCSKETLTINGQKYTIVDLIGEGGFSTVYLVKNSYTNEKFAIKKIVCHSKDDEQSAIEEIKYHSLLKHDNIIECIDSEVKGNASPVSNSTSQALLVLPYYNRGTLAQELDRRLKTNDYFTPIEVLNIFKKICEAVSVFHQMKPDALVHRDLKTANILLDDGYNPIIMDLGSVALARVQVFGAHDAQTLQDTAAEKCSMPYRAPELFNVESYCVIDERTDIWALGCILYALCYFKSPFDSVYERGDSVALAVMSAKINFPENTPFNEDMENLILFMLKTNIIERPFISSVIERVDEAIQKLEGRV